MLPTQIVYFLNFFDIFGYDSGLSILSRHRKLTYLICVLHILVAALFTVYKVHLTLWLYYDIGIVEVVNVTMQFSAPTYTYWMIIFDSSLHRREHQRFWNIVQRIDTSYCRQVNAFQRFIFKMIAYFSIAISFFLVFQTEDNSNYPGSIFVYLTLITVCQIRIFHYLFCLEVIQFQLKVIEHEWKTLNIANCSNEWKRFRGYYATIHELTILLNETFGCSNVAAILFGFYTVLTDVNVIYSRHNGYSTAQLLSK